MGLVNLEAFRQHGPKTVKEQLATNPSQNHLGPKGTQ